MQRLVLLATVLVAAMLVDLCPAPAHAGPWCAVVSIGKGAMQQDCRFTSFEECVPNVIAGNRGFCNRNPRWTGLYEHRPHWKRHARKH
jgi:hypothetical protein